MRNFLHKIMVDITRHPREIVEPVWSNNSWTHNFFRTYEYFFGRRKGIRREVTAVIDHSGRQITTFGTWESLFAFSEGVVKAFLKGLLPRFEFVPVPVFVTPDGMQVRLSPFRFAIAYVTSGTQSLVGSGNTISLAVSGSNTYIFAMPVGVSGSGGTDPLITSTYAGVNMSNTASTNIKGTGTSAIWIRGDYLPAPTTGTNNYVSTESGGQFMYGSGASVYSGVDQTNPPDEPEISNWTHPNASTDIICTFTSATTNCWVTMFGFTESGTLSASTNATLRASGGPPIVVDSNGTVSPTLFAITITGANVGAAATGGYGFKFAQVASASVNSGFFFWRDR